MYFSPLAESGIHLVFNTPLLIRPNPNKTIRVHKNLESEIILIKMFPGIQESVIKHIVGYKNLRGLILETYGTGNVTTEKWFLDSIPSLIDQKIRVLNSI